MVHVVINTVNKLFSLGISVLRLHFITTQEMLILADSSTMNIRVGLIGGPWLQQLTPLQDSGLNVPQIAGEAGQPNTSWGHSRITFMQALTEWALEQSSCL